MKPLHIAGLVSVLVSALSVSGAPKKDGVEGDWLGAIEVGAVRMRIALHVKATATGFTGTIDSIDQGANGIPLSAIEFHPPTLQLALKSMGAKFDGNLSDDASEIAGKWSQGGQSFALTFKRMEKAIALNRPQEPKKPYPYREEAMTITNSKAGVKLQGTLTLPATGDHFPAVLLITGSGYHDRDESLMGHKPFLVLSDYLTRHGIAVLRVDDRGVGGSTGNKLTSTDDDLTEDVLVEAEWLRQHRDIDPKRVGLIGHSEGGFIAPLAARGDTEVFAQPAAIAD